MSNNFWSEEVFAEVEEKSSNFEVLPEGNYDMVLIDSNVKTTKAGTGHYLNAQFEVTGPSHVGRKVFQTFNVNNPNPKAVSIGLGQLKDFLAAADKMDFYETLKTVTSWEEAEAHLNNLFYSAGNIPVIGKVTIKRSDEYGDKNEIKGFRAGAAPVISAKSSAKPAEIKKPF